MAKVAVGKPKEQPRGGIGGHILGRFAAHTDEEGLAELRLEDFNGAEKGKVFLGPSAAIATDRQAV